MDVIFKPFALEAKAVDGDASLRKMTFTVSAGNVDRDGDTIDPAGWDLEAYKKNPVVLWHHDTTIPPIAKSERVWVEDGKLKALAVFPAKGVHPFADTIHDLVEGGWLNGASVGFRPIEKAPTEKGVAYKRQELYEWSILPVPSNREALREAKAAGVDTEPVLKWAREFLATNGDEAVRKALAEAVPVPPPSPGATTDKGDHAGTGAVLKYVRQEGDKWCVFSKDDKKLGCHDTEDEAKAQLAAIEANKHERSPAQWEAIVNGWLSLNPTITADQLESVCPSCAKSMRDKGIKSFQFRAGMSWKEFPGGMSAASLAGLCDKFGEDEGFFTRCAESGLANTMDNVEGFCADLHRYCIGKWPGERSAVVVDVKQPLEVAADGVMREPRLVSDILAEQEKDRERWDLQSALYSSIDSIIQFAEPAARADLLRETVSQFVAQQEALKAADEYEALAAELFAVKQPPPGAPPEGAPPEGPAATPPEGPADEGFGIPEVDDAMEALHEAVGAALALTDPQEKANALKAALEAFAQVAMTAKPPAPAAPPAEQAPAGEPPADSPVQMAAELKAVVEKVGRVLSGKNEQRLRAALDALNEILTTLPQMPDGVPFLDGDSTTPDRNGKSLDIDEAQLKGLVGDDVDVLLRTELDISREDLRAVMASAVKEAMAQGRTRYDGRLPD